MYVCAMAGSIPSLSMRVRFLSRVSPVQYGSFLPESGEGLRIIFYATFQGITISDCANATTSLPNVTASIP